MVYFCGLCCRNKANPGSRRQKRIMTSKTSPFNTISRILMQHLEEVDFHGWDPFDALNSKVFNATPLAHSAFARLAWTQLLKRSPINFRKILDIAPTTNPVTLALATEIYRR